MADPSKSFDELNKKFSTAATGWGGIAQASASAVGNQGAAQAIEGLTKVLAGLIDRLFTKLRETFANFNPFPSPDPLSAFLDAALDEMLDTLIEAVAVLRNTAAAGLDAAAAGLLGLFEAIKKAIHLVLDQVPNKILVGPIEVVLDLINNVIGNIAQLMSDLAGKLATTFRMNMYGQLAASRAAKSARPDAFTEDDTPDGR